MCTDPHLVFCCCCDHGHSNTPFLLVFLHFTLHAHAHDFFCALLTETRPLPSAHSTPTHLRTYWLLLPLVVGMLRIEFKSEAMDSTWHADALALLKYFLLGGPLLGTIILSK